MSLAFKKYKSQRSYASNESNLSEEQIKSGEKKHADYAFKYASLCYLDMVKRREQLFKKDLIAQKLWESDPQRYFELYY